MKKKLVYESLDEILENKKQINEGWFSKYELSKEEALAEIKKHPAKNAFYEKLVASNDNKKLEKFIEFVMKEPYTNYFGWSESKQEFVPTGIERHSLRADYAVGESESIKK